MRTLPGERPRGLSSPGRCASRLRCIDAAALWILAAPALLLGGGLGVAEELERPKEAVRVSQAMARGQCISTIGSERATSGGGNKIATYDGKTHVVWQDATAEGYFNRVRTLDHATGEWSDPITLNKGVDNHARPVLTVDHEGYLHAVLSGHNSPVTHRRSAKPNDSNEWLPPVVIGNGTYPVIVCGREGSLYVIMRSAKRWNGVDLYVKRPSEGWKMLCKLVKRRDDLPGYAAFHGGLAVGPDGTLHCVVDFYEGKGVMDQRGLHQAVCYLRSRDHGTTWEKADGTAIALPARPGGLDILAQTLEEERHEPMPPPEVLAQGCIVTDAWAAPHVLYVSHLQEPGQVLHAWPDAAGRWQRQPIGVAPEVFPNHRPTGCRGALTTDAAGNLYALLAVQPLGDGWIESKPTRAMNWNAEGKRLVWLISKDRGATWEAPLALPEGAVFNQPNVERPTGVNIPKSGLRPPFVYFDGSSRYRKEGEIIQNNVYFAQ